MSALHVHIEDCSRKPDVFRLTQQAVKRAKARDRDTWSRVRVTQGCDLADIDRLRRADALITSNDVLLDPAFPLRNLAQAAPQLRWIHVIGAGVEKIVPLDWLPPNAVLTNNSGVHIAKVGEFATMALLMLNASVPQIVTDGRERRWNQVFTGLIAGKIALIVGLGDMGGMVARKAKQLGMRVIGVRRTLRPVAGVDQVITVKQLDRAIPKADIVIIAAPLTPETRHLISADRIARMKPTAGLINIGRAAVVDYAALCAALNERRIAGAILDVFEQEPLPDDSPLWTTRNLIVFPHVSSDDADNYIDLTLDLAAKNLGRLLAGKRLLNVVDRRTMY